MTEPSKDSIFDDISNEFGIGVSIIGGCIAIAYACFGGFANPDCGTAAILSGKIASVVNSSGGITLKLEGEPTAVRYAAPGKDRGPLTKALENTRGNLATISYRTGDGCSGGRLGAGERVFPITIEVNGSLLLSEAEVRSAVSFERTMLVTSGVCFIGLGIFRLVSKRRPSLT